MVLGATHPRAGGARSQCHDRRPGTRRPGCALLPRPGQSVADQLQSEPELFNPEMFTAQAPFWEDEAVAICFLLHDCPAEVAREALRQLRPEPGVLGSEVTPAWARRAASERLGVEPIEIPSGHCPFLSHPEELAEALHRCSRTGRRLGTDPWSTPEE